MLKLIAASVTAFLSISLCNASESGKPMGPPDAALTLAFETIYGKAEGPGGGPFNPNVVVSDKVPALNRPTAFNIPLAIKSRDEARNEQLAWFVYVSGISVSETGLELKYDKPYNGYYGTVKLANSGGAWTLLEHQTAHSSSGARMLYGKLYEGVACRDGVEMALRWNGYIDAVEASKAKRPRKEHHELPTTCPGKVFPDVNAYILAKQLGIAE